MSANIFAFGKTVLTEVNPPVYSQWMAAEENESSNPWRIEPLTDFEAPAMPTQETVRKKFGQFFRKLQRRKSVDVAAEMQRPPATLLDAAAPEPSPEPFFAAFDAVAGPWLARDRDVRAPFIFVRQPGDGPELLSKWAAKHKGVVVKPPASSAILKGNPAALPSLQGTKLLVIPDLENWFLRHHNGLGLVREWINRLGKTSRPCVIGVESWAWSFLNKAASASLELPPAFCLAPFDGSALSVWFSDLAESQQPGRFLFRSISSGEILLDPVKNGSSKSHESAHAEYLNRLAAISRGSPHLAWHLFRDSLQVAGGEADEAGKTAKKDSDPREVVWVDPLAEVSLPELPKDMRSAALLVLHALQIHGSLNSDDLELVLPPIPTSHMLHRLRREKIIFEDHGRWRILPPAYPAVRDALSHAGYPLDAC